MSRSVPSIAEEERRPSLDPVAAAFAEEERSGLLFALWGRLAVLGVLLVYVLAVLPLGRLRGPEGDLARRDGDPGKDVVGKRLCERLPQIEQQASFAACCLFPLVLRSECAHGYLIVFKV